MPAPMQAYAQVEAAWRDPTEVLCGVAEEPWAVGFLSGGDPDDPADG